LVSVIWILRIKIINDKKEAEASASASASAAKVKAKGRTLSFSFFHRFSTLLKI